MAVCFQLLTRKKHCEHFASQLYNTLAIHKCSRAFTLFFYGIQTKYFCTFYRFFFGFFHSFFYGIFYGSTNVIATLNHLQLFRLPASQWKITDIYLPVNRIENVGPYKLLILFYFERKRVKVFSNFNFNLLGFAIFRTSTHHALNYCNLI